MSAVAVCRSRSPVALDSCRWRSPAGEVVTFPAVSRKPMISHEHLSPVG
jgi:hypothetical protein